MPDFKGLKGDTSDNIPGVPGIGDKTAMKLIEQFGSIENLYEHIDDVTPEKLRENLRAHEADARHSKDMATIHCDGAVHARPRSDAARSTTTARASRSSSASMEFKSLITRLPPARRSGRRAQRPPAGARDVTEAGYQHDLQREGARRAGRRRSRRRRRSPSTPRRRSQHALRCSLVGDRRSRGRRARQRTYRSATGPRLGDPEQLPLKTVVAKLKPVFENEKIEKSGHNVKFDMEVLAGCGIELRGVAFDTMIAAYLIGEGGGEAVRPGGGSLGLKWLAARRLSVEMTAADRPDRHAARSRSRWPTCRVEQAAPYACADADMALRLREPMEADLKEQGLSKLFAEIEMPLVPVLARMERAGVAVDTDALREMSQSLDEADRASWRSEAYESVGHEFNLGSPQQLSQVLFEELQLPKTRRTKQGYTTDATALEGLRDAHPI